MLPSSVMYSAASAYMGGGDVEPADGAWPNRPCDVPC